MTLLFDQNISFKISKKLQDIFPESKHLSDLKLEGYSDIATWEYAKINNYSIVTFDFDYIDIATLRGFPPKIIWLRTGVPVQEKNPHVNSSSHSLSSHKGQTHPCS